jgi:C-3',4' desaturase CrtD
MTRVIVIGAGFGGLAAAAELAKSGMDVTILEAHNLPGGCASTFYHQGFQFDSGATLAGGFDFGAPMDLLGKRLGISWDVQRVTRAMVVHLPDGHAITRWTDHDRWVAERNEAFGVVSSRFWDWQEQTADLLWDLALRLPEWPPQTKSELFYLTRKGFHWAIDNHKNIQRHRFLSLFTDSFRQIFHYLKELSPHLNLFVDSQLLISSQTTSIHANALYGAVALDFPRRGVVEVPGGMVSLAKKLVGAIERFGGTIQYHKEVTQVSHQPDSKFLVHTRGGHEYHADVLIFNLPPWNIKSLTKDINIKRLESLLPIPPNSWGAFTLYIGIDSNVIAHTFANHHQVIASEPLGEGNSIFLSLSPDGDQARAPENYRALTISTHTKIGEWWRLFKQDKNLYEQRKLHFVNKILDNAELILPGLRSTAKLILPGTPVTFQRFTRRESGWLGGFPQTGLFNVWGPRLGRNLWMVGDSIFPGQSIPSVAMGGIRVAQSVISEYRSQKSITSFTTHPLIYNQ